MIRNYKTGFHKAKFPLGDLNVGSGFGHIARALFLVIWKVRKLAFIGSIGAEAVLL